MKKLEKALIAVTLSSTLFVTGVSFAQQDRNQNGNGNSNRGNQNSNGNMMNGNANSNMMNGNTSTNSNIGTGMGAGSGMINGMIGNVTVEEFQRVNQQSGAAVAAITPSNTPLSKGDQKLMTQVAMEGMMQLEVSRAALPKVSSEQARVLAQAEVEEQTAIAAKLREIATAKNVTLPNAPNAKTTSMVAKMNSMAAGTNFDQMYIRDSGVKGHQRLDKTMTKVESKGADDNLKALAAAAHPNVRLHLQVSQAELDRMSSKGTTNNSNRTGGSTSGGSDSNRTGGSTSSGSNSNSNR